MEEYLSHGSRDHPVILRMTQLAGHWRAADDKRHLFLSCYSTMTGNMLKAADRGEFRDAIWVTGLLERFADYYFDALDLCECNAPHRPLVWEHTHRMTLTRRLHVLQHLLLGINAHINYDLVLTLHDILKPEWPTADDRLRTQRLEDHLKVNDIIASTIDTVQDEIIEVQAPMMDVLDKLMGRVDEYLLSRLISRWRNDVWKETMAMLEITDPAKNEFQRRLLEQKVLRTARRIVVH